MSHPATFSELFHDSYALTRSLLRTYVNGAVLLIIIIIAGRSLGSALFSAVAHAEGQIGTQAILGLVGAALMLTSLIAQMMQQVFALVLVIDRSTEIKPTLKKALRFLLPVIGGGIWIFLRSFAWIVFLSLPFFAVGQDYPIGYVLGGLVLIAGLACWLFYFPRLSFVNVIQLREGTGIRKSANLSFERTYGYWGKIVGNNILFSLCMLLCLAGVCVVGALPVVIGYGLYYAFGMAVALIISIPLGLAAAAIIVVVFFGIALFPQVYLVKLYDTIQANPITKKV